ncbi:protein of unknown function [Candidatus Pantoea symbiotica]|uniref:DUF4325 domain-containing protein n=1 Tax=Candidatus Pantoea symbiotica TaxID=1884370 RepID=A0A1I3UV19_9GAMM|nr:MULTISPECIES: DUF4325 domain-containing protein [Pantoea]SFJ86875.1 protein of unknown function [Pantoea symbiotica]SFU61248.1 protein of unknown function [Pantoea sp. YR525]
MNKVIKVSEKFPYPGPRFIKLGPQSGEAFKMYLYKQLKDIYGETFNDNLNYKVTINLDQTIGYGSSFLEEGFGGLIRMGVPFNIVNNIHIISNEEPELIGEIKEYIEDEKNKHA